MLGTERTRETRRVNDGDDMWSDDDSGPIEVSDEEENGMEKEDDQVHLPNESHRHDTQTQSCSEYVPTYIPTGTFTAPPTLEEAKSALSDITAILRPPYMTEKGKKKGYKDSGLDRLTSDRLEGIQMLLRAYSAEKSDAKHKWIFASLRAAEMQGRGPKHARSLRVWAREFLADRNNLPENVYGTWAKSLIDDEDLVQEISVHLQGLGKYIKAEDICRFLDTPEMLERLKRKKTISRGTAQRWLRKMGYRWTRDPKGMYADGHERGDVVWYRQNVFLPAWKEIDKTTRKWNKDGTELQGGEENAENVEQHESQHGNAGRHEASGSTAALGSSEPRERSCQHQRRTVVWFHDESTFYANDRRRSRWVHKSETAVPYAKGEGASLMVADFVSADYGWLCSPDKAEEARILFQAGKNRDGYFTNDDIIQQTEKAMDILKKYYPDDDHVLVFDNATTHLKRADDALSARKMPKGPSKPQTNFGVEVRVIGADGKPVYGPDGKLLKQKIRIGKGTFNDQEHDFYHPDNHPTHPGLFKGMATILEERGFTGVQQKRAECPKFACLPNATDCCCRRILYNQPDFVNIESVLETVCKAQGFRVLFLPKFHCELNFIEQCWGYAKRCYRLYPASSKEEDLKRNLLSALESVHVTNMRR